MPWPLATSAFTGGSAASAAPLASVAATSAGPSFMAPLSRRLVFLLAEDAKKAAILTANAARFPRRDVLVSERNVHRVRASPAGPPAARCARDRVRRPVERRQVERHQRACRPCAACLREQDTRPDAADQSLPARAGRRHPGGSAGVRLRESPR